MKTLDLIVAVQGTGLELRPVSIDGKVVQWSLCFPGAKDMIFTGKPHQVSLWLQGWRARGDFSAAKSQEPNEN